MSHTFSRQFVHIVFGIKNLNSSIPTKHQSSLYGYITGIIKRLGGFLIARSGTSNHIHLLVNTPTSMAISKFLCQLKAGSSKWIHQKGGSNLNFDWEDGFAAFSVSLESIPKVKQYFLREESRHSTYPFEQELVSFLNIHEIKFDPRFLTKNTHTQLLYHIVWTVKNREPLLGQSIKTLLHDKIRKEVQGCCGKLHAIGNVNDHIHILIDCPSHLATSCLVQALKTKTSSIINKFQNSRMGKFGWQEGYGVFSIGRPALEVVTNYVLNQEEHHKFQSFEDEWKKITAMNFMG